MEDNAGDRVLLQEMFRNYPLTRPLSLLTARTLSESRRFLSKTPIDAVLLDPALPDGQGIETLRKFREMNEELPVVVLSGMKEESIAISSLSAGAQDFLVKEMVTAPLLLRSVTYAIKRKEIERSLTTLANSDTLTGLPNRKSFMEQLQRSIDTNLRSGDSFGLLILDLDRFKAVNDTYGHAAGDTLIREVAGRLRRLMRRADFVARLGGDEFAIILNHTGRTGSLSRFIEKLILRLGPPYTIGRHSISSEASVGAAVFPIDGDNAEELVSRADRAMYLAKASGTRRYAFYDPVMDKEESARTQSIQEISRALAEDAFQLCFQPVVNLLSGELVYAEALVRWNHPEKGYLSPHSFLPLIAGTEATTNLDHWVLEAAIAQVAHWHTEGHPIPVSINLDATTLAQPAFPDEVAHCLRAHAELPPGLIRIEVREWVETGNLPRIRHTLELLNSMGILTSLDDFGRGPTTLPGLTALPLEGLKLDQSVILDFQKGDRNMALIEGVASLARCLGHKVVAKGLEKTKYGLLLEKLGCDLAQGFGISSPLPSDEFLAWKMAWTESPLSFREDSRVSESELRILCVLLSHLEWIYRAILEVQPIDGTSPPPAPEDPGPCPVLPWFSGEGYERYRSLPVFDPLLRITEEIDGIVRSMYGELSRGHRQETMAHVHRLLALKDRLQALYHSLQKEALLHSLSEDPHTT
ncbi:MAG: two-component system response regulator [Leptospirillia bacterium]